jgi:hypothetical protein
LTYAKKSETEESQEHQAEKTSDSKPESNNDEYFSVERVVKEYATIK